MQVKKLLPITASKSPSPAAAMIPIGVLILGLVAIVYYAGAGAIADYALSRRSHLSRASCAEP